MSDINELVELFEDAVYERPSERDSVCDVTTAIGYSCLEHFARRFWNLSLIIANSMLSRTQMSQHSKSL
jgi:hypothetical protein